jgi:MscS family membrane protein
LGVCVLALGGDLVARAQTVPPPESPPAPAAVAQPRDVLGRSTPRGTVLGFVNAGRKGDNELARQYLNTELNGGAAHDLAHQLFVVLDVRLSARLAQLSDTPEGSRANPLAPDEEIVGTIAGGAGEVAIVVERVRRGEAEPIWLISRKTLDAIPDLYEQVARTRAEAVLPRLLFDRKVAGVRLFDWLAVLLGLPLLYFATALLNRALTPLVRLVWRRAFGESNWVGRNALPAPARLLILALVSRWLVLNLPVSLLLREFLSSIAILLTIVAVAWLLMLLNGEVEAHALRRLPHSNAAAVSLLRVGRRVVDLLVIIAALLVMLRRFGIDATPALAGLGVGGIAVALAAQKTLENVIAGASLIFDQAVRVGDFLKMGEIVGTVDHIGLRSTRIRTLDRTIVSVPNSQIANTSLETISARDKFWFHPVVGLRYETTPDQLRAVVNGIHQRLCEHPSIVRESVRVRFLRLGAFSLDVDVFAYLNARDWAHFLEIQEQLLFSVTEIVSRAGTSIAFPSQTMYVANGQASLPSEPDGSALPKSG